MKNEKSTTLQNFVFSCLSVIFLITPILSQQNIKGFGFRRKLEIQNLSGQFLKDEDILIFLDTKKLVEDSNLYKNCSDMLFLDYWNRTLNYFLEGSCGEINTRVYVTMNLTADNTNNTIFFYYRNPTVSNEMQNLREEFEGNFYLMSNSTCGSTWKEDVSTFDKLPFIENNQKSSNGGYSHSHFIFGNTEGGTSALGVSYYDPHTPAGDDNDPHSHFFVVDSDPVHDMETILPPYKNVIFCLNQYFDLEKGFISLYDQQEPNGFSFFSETEGKFPFSSNSYGNEGGNLEHTHYFEGYSEITYVYQWRGQEGKDTNFKPATTDHTHKITCTSEGHSNVPQNNVEIPFGYISDVNAFFEQLKSNNSSNQLIMASSIPPKGFKVDDSFNGFFLRSGSSGELKFNGFSGSATITHQHLATPTVEETEDFVVSYGGNDFVLDSKHTHLINLLNTTLGKYDLPYFSFVILQRKPINTRIVMYGTEQISETLEKYPEEPTDDGNDTETPGSSSMAIFIVLGIFGIIFCIIFMIISIFLFVFILFRIRNKRITKKTIDSIVNNAEKEEELQEEKDNLEKENQKLEMEKEELEKQKKSDELEKMELKKALEELKKEKNIVSTSSHSISFRIPVIHNSKITKIAKLSSNNLSEISIHKAKYEKRTVMYRVFDQAIFEKGKSIFKPINLIEFEIQKYASFKHPNILNYIALSLKPEVGIVSHFPANGTLVDFFQKKTNKSMKFLKKVRIFYEIASAIQFIHSLGIPHGDIRSSNCFIDGKLRPQLDSGFNKTFDTKIEWSQYCAPELIKTDLLLDHVAEEDDEKEDAIELKADIYAFGVLMVEVVKNDFNLYKIPKGKKMKIGEKVANDKNFGIKVTSKYLPGWFKNLIKMTLAHDPSQRPSIKRIKMLIEAIVEQE